MPYKSPPYAGPDIITRNTNHVTGKILHNALQAALLTILLLLIPHVNSAPSIPEDLGQVDQWLNSVVKPYTERKDSLDPPLEAAEAAPKVIKVRKDGSGDFDTITKAIASVPAWNTNRTIIWIGPGQYEEKITIDRDKPFITLYGSPNAVPTLVFGGTAAKYGTVDSATLIVMSDYFVAANLIIKNSATMPDGKMVGAQAVALRASGDKQAFYNCRFLGYQDTLCDDRGNHFFKDCYVEGTVDFIFRSGKSIYLGTELHVLGTGGLRIITAQARELANEDQGYSFVHGSVTGSGNGTYLGRAWKARPLVVFAYTDMGSVVNPAGWSDNFQPDRDSLVFYGGYKCKGEGSNLSKRVNYTKVLSDAEAQPFISLDFIKANTWLLPPPKL